MSLTPAGRHGGVPELLRRCRRVAQYILHLIGPLLRDVTVRPPSLAPSKLHVHCSESWQTQVRFYDEGIVFDSDFSWTQTCMSMSANYRKTLVLHRD
jgi:hypothetical protein